MLRPLFLPFKISFFVFVVAWVDAMLVPSFVEVPRDAVQRTAGRTAPAPERIGASLPGETDHSTTTWLQRAVVNCGPPASSEQEQDILDLPSRHHTDLEDHLVDDVTTIGAPHLADREVSRASSTSTLSMIPKEPIAADIPAQKAGPVDHQILAGHEDRLDNYKTFHNQVHLPRRGSLLLEERDDVSDVQEVLEDEQKDDARVLEDEHDVAAVQEDAGAPRTSNVSSTTTQEPCLICLSDTPEHPVICPQCRTATACFSCIERWARDEWRKAKRAGHGWESELAPVSLAGWVLSQVEKTRFLGGAGAGRTRTTPLAGQTGGAEDGMESSAREPSSSAASCTEKKSSCRHDRPEVLEQTLHVDKTLANVRGFLALVDEDEDSRANQKAAVFGRSGAPVAVPEFCWLCHAVDGCTTVGAAGGGHGGSSDEDTPQALEAGLIDDDDTPQHLSDATSWLEPFLQKKIAKYQRCLCCLFRVRTLVEEQRALMREWEEAHPDVLKVRCLTCRGDGPVLGLGVTSLGWEVLACRNQGPGSKNFSTNAVSRAVFVGQRPPDNEEEADAQALPRSSTGTTIILPASTRPRGREQRPRRLTARRYCVSFVLPAVCSSFALLTSSGCLVGGIIAYAGLRSGQDTTSADCVGGRQLHRIDEKKHGDRGRC